MKLYAKHLATWLLTIYLICAFVQWDLCILQDMSEQDRVAYIGISILLSATSFFFHLSYEDEIC